MNREIVVTADGSHSISIPSMNISYHSLHGAVQESTHVFIQAGLQYALNKTEQTKPLYIFELGFGTGLNALLTIIEAERTRRPIRYETIEPFPLDTALPDKLNYCEQLQRTDLKPLFEQLHHGEWGSTKALNPYFSFKKEPLTLAEWLERKDTAAGSPGIDIVYFDAFAPESQPELWTTEAFSPLYKLMAPGGLLVTYCSKTVVRRALESAGFIVTKIPGPRGKREMLRAVKTG